MKRSRSLGFTLLEVLIGITLLGVMVTLLFASLRIAAQSWHTGEDKIAAVNEKAVVYQFFKRHLSAIRPVSFLENAESAQEDAGQMVFQGLPQRLRFVAALPMASARKGLQIFTIEADPRQASVLQVSLRPYQPLDAEEAVVDPPVVLLEHVETFNFSYFGSIEEGEVAMWHDTWNQVEGLPRLIKISITLQDHGDWPPMVIEPRIHALHEATVGMDDSDEPGSSGDAENQ